MGLPRLGAGPGLDIGMHGDFAQSVSGFLLGISLVFILFGFLRPKPGALG